MTQWTSSPLDQRMKGMERESTRLRAQVCCESPKAVQRHQEGSYHCCAHWALCKWPGTASSYRGLHGSRQKSRAGKLTAAQAQSSSGRLERWPEVAVPERVCHREAAPVEEVAPADELLGQGPACLVAAVQQGEVIVLALSAPVQHPRSAAWRPINMQQQMLARTSTAQGHSLLLPAPH